MRFGCGVRRTLVGCAVGVMAIGLLATVRVGAAGAADPACPPAAAPTGTPTRVLLAGDSMTNGSAGDYTWRYFFSRHLAATGANVDLVGPWDDLIDNISGAWWNHDYAACGFDQDHYARGGAKLADFLEPPAWNPEIPSSIRWATDYYDADVVVQFLGFNDLYHGATPADLLANAKRFLDEARAARPDVTVVMTTLATSLLPDGPEYNRLLAQAVPTWTTPRSRVVLADAMRDWAGESDTWDGAHPNARGEMHVAAALEDAFAGLGLGGPAVRPFPSIPIGPRRTATLDATSDGTGVTLTWTPPPGSDRTLVQSRDVGVTATWTPLADVERTEALAVTGLAAGHTYQFRVQSAKGTAVATDLFSNVVSAVATGTTAPTPSTTPTPTPSTSPTPTPTDPATPTGTPTLTPTVTPTPSITPTPTPTRTVTATPTVPITLGRALILRTDPSYHAAVVIWGDVPGATSYRLRWRAVGTSAWHTRASAGTATIIAGLVAGQRYAVDVTALNGAVQGQDSLSIEVVPHGTVNPAVPRPRLVRVNGHRLRATWSPAVDATRYEVSVRRVGGGWRVLGWTAAPRFTSGRLVAGGVYQVRVRAFDQYVAGRYSAVAPRLRVR